MGLFGINIQVVRNELPAIEHELVATVRAGGDKGAAKLEQAIQDNAPVLTGAMQASVFRITDKVNEFPASVAAMISLNGRAMPIDEPGHNPGEAIVGVAADYGVYVDQGHAMPQGGYVPANPFFSSVVNNQSGGIVDDIKGSLLAMLQRHRIF